MSSEIVLQLVPQFIEAGLLTLGIGFFGVTLSLVLGFAIEVVHYFNVPVLKQIVKVYFEVSRNTPLIIQLFFLYYALPKLGLNLSAETCAVAGLVFLGGSYMYAAIDSGVQAIAGGEIESAKAIGLTKGQALRLLIIPQGAKLSLQGIFANFIFLIKETSVFSAIAVVDLMSAAKNVIGLTYNTNESLFLLVASYTIILLPFVVIYYILQHRLKVNELVWVRKRKV